MKCDHCRNDVPDGVFCTRCGAHQGMTGEHRDEARDRMHHYAAQPGEHVLQPNVFSTLFPHLGHHKIHEFRWAFIVGVAGVFVLYLTGLVTPAIVVAALLVPLIYLIYLYEAQVYRDEPLPVLGLTIGGGIVLGIVVTLIANRLSSPATVSISGGAPADVGALLLVTLVIPIVQEIVKPLPALLLRGRPQFKETVDGLTFGIAAGLGFAAAETIIRFSSVIGTLPVHTDPANWIYPLLQLAILLPILQGSTTGVIAAALWRFGRGRAGTREIGAIVVAIAAHVAFLLVGQLLVNAGQPQIVLLAWQAAVVGVVLLYIRYLLHHSLLEEAAHMGFAETICPNCHRHIVASGFCPNCGMALTATPASVKDSRTPRPTVAAASTTEGI